MSAVKMHPAKDNQALIDFITAELISDPAEKNLDAEDDLLGSGLVDSLGVMRLIRFLEETYSVTVPAADVTLENFMTVRTIADYLETLRESEANG